MSLMNENELNQLRQTAGIAPWRLSLAERIESPIVQTAVTAIIVLNAAILGLETSESVRQTFGLAIRIIDTLCLAIFTVELIAKLAVYRSLF